MPLLDRDYRPLILHARTGLPIMRLPPWPVLAVCAPLACGCWLTLIWAARRAWMFVFRP